MTDETFDFLIRAEVEADELRKVEASLQRQIVRAKEAGESYDRLAERLANVRARLDELNAGGQGEALAKDTEAATKAVRAQDVSVGELSKTLKSSQQVSRGFGLGLQGIGQIVNGNVLGGVRSLTGAFRALTAAMLSNPIGLIIGLLGAAVIGFVKLREKIFDVSKEIEKFAAANAKNVDRVRESVAAVNREKVDAAVKQAAELADQWQRAGDETERQRRAADSLRDARLGEKLADIEMRRQHELEGKTDADERARTNLKYDREAMKARNQTGEEKADSAIERAAADLKAAAEQITKLNESINRAGVTRDNIDTTGRQLSDALAGMGVKSDQQRDLDRLDNLSKNGAANSQEIAEKKSLQISAEANRAAIKSGNVTYNQTRDELEKQQKQLAENIAKFSGDTGLIKSLRVRESGGTVDGTGAEKLKSWDEMNAKFAELTKALATVGSANDAQAALKNQREETRKIIAGLYQQLDAAQNQSNQAANNLEKSQIDKKTFIRTRAAEVAKQDDADTQQKNSESQAAAEKDLAEAIDALRLVIEKGEASGKSMTAERQRLNMLQLPANATQTQIERATFQNQQLDAKANNRAALADLRNPLRLDNRARGDMEGSEHYKRDSGLLSQAETEAGNYIEQALKDGQLSDAEGERILSLLEKVIEVAQATNNASQSNLDRIGRLQAAVTNLQSQAKNGRP